MLKPILHYSKSKNHIFTYSNCTLLGNNTQLKVKSSNNDSVWNDGRVSVRLKEGVSFGNPRTFHSEGGRKKKVQFNQTCEQDASDGKNCGNKKTVPDPKKKSQKKQSKNASNEAGLSQRYQPYWDFTSTKWAARLEDLVEMDKETLRSIQEKSPSGSLVYFNDCQAHLRIGTGPDYSSVFLGIMDGSSKVAVKKINLKRAPLLQDEARQRLLTELSPNPCLAKVYFITRDKTQFYIVRELCENSLKLEMNMWQYIPKAVRPSLKYADLCHEIAKSLAYLHGRNCCHMALRPENIFVTQLGGIKLADYGIHQRNISRMKQYENGARALCWLPSEALGTSEMHLTKATDIASLGMVFFWLITRGSHPFGDPESAADACIKNIIHGHYNLKAVEDSYAHHLIQHMIFKEPEKRITITQVLEHPYFWRKDQKAAYISSMARVVHLIAGSAERSNTICSSLMHALKTKESCILRSCTDVSLLKDCPEEFKTDFTKLLLHAHRNQRRDINGEDLCNVLVTVYPGILLEMHSQFSLKDLENLASDLLYTGGMHSKPDPFFMLQHCLSADSGIGSPGVDMDMQHDFETCGMPTFPFETSKRNRDNSECYASTDDGIDVLSPVCGSFSDEHVFSSPVKIDRKMVESKLIALDPRYPYSHEGSSGSVDTHFEFDRIDVLSEKIAVVNHRLDALWTDMDELD